MNRTPDLAAHLGDLWLDTQAVASRKADLNITLASLTLLIGEDIGWAESILKGRVGQYPDTELLFQPERGLSLKAQRAKVLYIVQRVRAGKRVILTTHGDLLAQQINNFMKLGTLRNMGVLQAVLDSLRAEGGQSYGLNDYLLPEDVVAYEVRFDNDRRLMATELERRPTGIVMTPFNREIDAQANEVDLLNELIQRPPESPCSL